ncbi:MAG: hypothetical protein AAGN35_26580 [Bacteroidota bacterium]
MSVDWYKFRLGAGVASEQLQALVTEQSRAFRKAVNWPRPGDHVTQQERSEAAQNYLSASSAMIPFISFVGRGKQIDAKAIAHIAFNDVFPPEWREEAKATLLPERIAGFLEKWERYAQDLRMGYYQDYITQLFLSEDYNLAGRGYDGWHQLLTQLAQASHAALDRGDEWAQTEATRRTLEEILGDPVLPLTPAVPIFREDLRDVDLSAATQAIFEEYKKETERLMAQVIAWNRCVPEAEKLRIPTFIPVQVRMRQRIMASREWLGPFFTWCHQVVAEGCGLFLAA